MQNCATADLQSGGGDDEVDASAQNGDEGQEPASEADQAGGVGVAVGGPLV